MATGACGINCDVYGQPPTKDRSCSKSFWLGYQRIEALELGGRPMKMGDHSWAFHPFPRLAVYYLFWDLETGYDCPMGNTMVSYAEYTI